MTQGSANDKKIDYLKEDPEIYGQKWVCLSFLTPGSVKMESDVYSVKCRGVFGSEEEARVRCEQIREFDADFNVYIAPVGKWLPWCDDPDKASDFNYSNEKLNNMMKTYYENQAKSKEEFEKRKNEMVQKSIQENEERKKENEKMEKRRKKKRNRKKKKLSQIDNTTVDKIEQDYKLELEKEQKEVEKREKEYKEAVNKIADVDDELKKAQELYDKLLKEEGN